MIFEEPGVVAEEPRLSNKPRVVAEEPGVVALHNFICVHRSRATGVANELGSVVDMNFHIPGRNLGFSKSADVKFTVFVKKVWLPVIKSTIPVDEGTYPHYG